MVFGFVIVFHPDMKLVGVLAFTGVTLIVEGVFDCVALVAQERRGYFTICCLSKADGTKKSRSQ